jgi:hypothetical protein
MSWVLLSEPWGFLALLVGILLVFGGALFVSWVIGEVLAPRQARKKFLERYKARQQWAETQDRSFSWHPPYNR